MIGTDPVTCDLCLLHGRSAAVESWRAAGRPRRPSGPRETQWCTALEWGRGGTALGPVLALAPDTASSGRADLPLRSGVAKRSPESRADRRGQRPPKGIPPLAQAFIKTPPDCLQVQPGCLPSRTSGACAWRFPHGSSPR